MPAPADIEAILQRHGYFALPAALEDTRLAVFHHESNGATIAEVLAYREIDGRGETLKDEAALLVEALPRISQQLSRQPDILSPDAQAHSVAFLGRRAHVLVGGDGRPLRCHLSPLLIVSSATACKAPVNRGLANLPIVRADLLDRYMAGQHHAADPEYPAIDAWLLHLRRSHQLLGVAFLTFPSLFGLSLLLASLGWLTLGLYSLFAAVLTPFALLMTALRHFRSFKQQNPSGVLTPAEPSSSTPTGSAQDSQSYRRNAPSNIPIVDEAEQTASWTPANSAAFLLDSMQSAMTACLSTYQGANWRAYAGHLNSLLANGMRLAVLNRTGRIPLERMDELPSQLPATEGRGELDTWLRRLAIARQTHPFATGEAQEAAHFVVRLLHGFSVLPPGWAAQILRIIPRPSRKPRHGDSLDSLTPTSVAAPSPLPSQSTPRESSENSLTFALPSTPEPTSIAPAVAGQLPKHQNCTASPILNPPGHSGSQGAPLNIVSERELDLLADLVRAEASPYLFVFGNRYLTHWKRLCQTAEEAAQRLNLQINVVVFPGLGGEKPDSRIEEFYRRFHVEGTSVPPPLPFICVLSRTVLLHVLEDNLPVPNELVVNPNPDGFLDRVRMVIPTAQAYQVDLKEPKAETDSDGEPAVNQENHVSGHPASLSQSPSAGTGIDNLPVHPVARGCVHQSLVVDVEEVVEELDSAPVSHQCRRVTEVDVEAALHGRELARVVPVALAVVHLPEHQHVVEALEATAQQEENLVAEYVDSVRYPNASEALRTEAGNVRLRYNGYEELLQLPQTDRLLACIRQLRATSETTSSPGQSAGAKPSAAVAEPPTASEPTKRRKLAQRRQRTEVSIATQSGG